MIRSFKCRDTEGLYNGYRCRRFQNIEGVARRKLRMLNDATSLRERASVPGNRVEALKSDRAGQYSIRVNERFRVCFLWTGEDAKNVKSSIITEGTRMPRKTKMLPPVHAGEILREEFMKPLGISINQLARDLRVPVTRISDIANGRRGIPADTALRLARYFNNSVQFWINLQTSYEIEVVESSLGETIARDVRPRNVA